MSVMLHPTSAGESWRGFTIDEAKKDDSVLLASKVKALDTLLGGGLSYGSQTCISAVNYQDAAFISHKLIASHLQGTQAEVTVVDTTNAFDVRALSQHIKSSQGIDPATVLTILDRVKLIRAFDFTGVRESIDKISAVLDALPQARHLVIIDKLSYTAGLVIKNNPVQGQAILDAFFRSLKALSNIQGSCVVLVEGFVPSRDHRADDCVLETSEQLRPFFNADTAPALDVHIHIHGVSTVQRGIQNGTNEHRVLEVASDRHGGRTGQWAYCADYELKAD